MTDTPAQTPRRPQIGELCLRVLRVTLGAVIVYLGLVSVALAVRVIGYLPFFSWVLLYVALLGLAAGLVDIGIEVVCPERRINAGLDPGRLPAAMWHGLRDAWAAGWPERLALLFVIGAFLVTVATIVLYALGLVSVPVLDPLRRAAARLG